MYIMKKDKENIMYIFVYLFMWLSGIIMFFTAGQKNKRMKFHSLQAIFLGIIAIVLDLALVLFLGQLVAFLIFIYGMYIAIKAYYGEDIKVPIVAGYAAKYSGYNP